MSQYFLMTVMLTDDAVLLRFFSKLSSTTPLLETPHKITRLAQVQDVMQIKAISEQQNGSAGNLHSSKSSGSVKSGRIWDRSQLQGE